MKTIHNLKVAYTHAGTFHADDVFGAAFLQLMNPAIEIVRVFKVTPDMDTDESIIFDIGLGEYDHHQTDKEVRPLSDGYYFDEAGDMKLIPYCAFGKLWRDYGSTVCDSEKAMKKVDRDLVIPIDKTDNGIERNMLSAAIHAFNPTWDSDTPSDYCFFQAVDVAKDILMNYIDHANADAAAEDSVLSSRVIDDHILVLDKCMPWQDTVIEHMPEILFVVFPSNRGGYCIQTVPDAPGSFNGRKGFPAEWLGNPDASLGMIFCHTGNFLASADTQENAINIAAIACAR